MTFFDSLFLTVDEKSTPNDLQTKARSKSDRINLLNARVEFRIFDDVLFSFLKLND